MKDPTFRTATRCDIDLLLDFIQEYYAFDRIEADMSALRPSLERLVSDSTLGRVWLIQDGNQPVGYTIMTFAYDLEFGGQQSIVTDLYITPEFRRQGIGSATLHFIEENCLALGFQVFELQVERENIAAQRFYERFGMTTLDRIPMIKWVRS